MQNHAGHLKHASGTFVHVVHCPLKTGVSHVSTRCSPETGVREDRACCSPETGVRHVPTCRSPETGAKVLLSFLLYQARQTRC